MSDMTSTKHYVYMNKNKEEMLAFTNGRLMAKAMKHTDTNVFRLFNKQTVADDNDRDMANRALFAEIIDMVGDHTLVTTLATLYAGDGQAALQAIKDEWEDGDADNQESNAHATYYRTMYDSSQKMTTDITAEEFNNKCNLLHTSRSELSSTDRRITNEAHAANLIDWVSSIDSEYKSDVKFAFLNKTTDQKKNPAFVQKTLASIIRTRSSNGNKTDSETIKTLKTLPQDDTEPKKQKCPKCGEFHWFNPKKPEMCMTYMRACGQTPDKWNDKSETFRTKIDEKASALTQKLKGKDPKIKIAVTKVVTFKTTTEAEETPKHLVVRLTAPAPKPVVLYIDSQGGPGFHYHFIKDKHLFDHIDTSHKTVHVGGVIGMDESTAPSHGFGTCTVDVITDSGPIAMRLTNCLYVPGMESNVFNVWHALHAHNIKPIIEKTKSHLLFDDGSKIPNCIRTSRCGW